MFAIVFCLAATLPASAYRKEVFVIQITGDGFVPRKTEIKREQTVVFKNLTQSPAWPSLVPLNGGETDIGPLKKIGPEETWGFTFNKTGAWKISDRSNEKFEGELVVKEDDGYSPFYVSLKEQNERKFYTNTTIWYKTLYEKFRGAILTLFGLEQKKTEKDFNTSLKNNIKELGAGKAIQILENEVDRETCHKLSHQAGEYAYELFKENAFQWHTFAFSSECGSGYFHGLMDAYLQTNDEHRLLEFPIADFGEKNIINILHQVCDKSPFDLKCAHVLGHSIMAWSNYDLLKALPLCDKISAVPAIQNECWRGIFMENVDGGRNQDVGHFTKYISDDPFYPCNIVGEKYKVACYQFIPGRLEDVMHTNPHDAELACAKIPSPYENICFSSLGVLVMRKEIDSPKNAAILCSNIPNTLHRSMCIIGAAEESVFNQTKQKSATIFCGALTDQPSKFICYSSVFKTARRIYSDDVDYNNFCVRVGGDFTEECKNFKK